MTPDELSKVEQESERRVNEWYQSLSREEASAWADAYEDDCVAKIIEAEEEVAGCKALLWLAKQCPPGAGALEAVEMIRQKPSRSLAEVEALDAWDRIKNKKMLYNPADRPK